MLCYVMLCYVMLQFLAIEASPAGLGSPPSTRDIVSGGTLSSENSELIRGVNFCSFLLPTF